jgi:hypothetical protein
VKDFFNSANLFHIIEDNKLLVSQLYHLGGMDVYEGIQPADIKTRHVSSIVDEFVVIKSFIFYIYDPPINHLPTLVGRIVDPIVPIVLQNSSGQY